MVGLMIEEVLEQETEVLCVVLACGVGVAKVLGELSTGGE
jgi:hypothetical protein